jgi:hypothetical protein
MQKPWKTIAGLALLLGVASGAGCHREEASLPPAPQAQTQVPPAQPPDKTFNEQPPPPAKESEVAGAVNKLLAEEKTPEGLNSPFPKGTRLLSVTIQDGVATLDFSKEFNQLADSGETTESMAQKALRKTLSHFVGVEKMRVTVEGRPFESQATDWNTPFPVEDDRMSQTEKLRHPIAGGRE